MSKAAQEEKALGSIKSYLVAQNRPYSAIDVFNNLRQEFGKTLVIKTLESLAVSKDIVEKAVGKQKIYFANQDNFPKFDETELRALDQQLVDTAEALKTELAETKTLENQVKSLNVALTTSDLKTAIADLRSKCSSRSVKLEQLKLTCKNVEPEQKIKLSKLHSTAIKEWRGRKRTADEMLNSILENCPKKKKDLFEEIGVETDEEHKVALPQ